MKEKEKTYLDVADKGIAEFAGQIGIRDYEKSEPPVKRVVCSRAISP